MDGWMDGWMDDRMAGRMSGFVPGNHISIESAGNLRTIYVHEVHETKVK
jgi:murein DD-endopeptidase MepM/ murein hydrolase activator NlpD